MKPFNVKFSLFVFLTFFVTVSLPLEAAKEIPGKPISRAEKEKLFSQSLDMNIAMFKKQIQAAKLTKDDQEYLIGILIGAVDRDKKDVRDFHEKILFLAGMVDKKELKQGVGKGLLKWAYKRNDKPMIKKLRALGYDIDRAFLSINEKDELYLIPILLRDGAHINAQYYMGGTLLIELVRRAVGDLREAKEEEAFEKGSYARAKIDLKPYFDKIAFLVQKGANPTIKNKEGESALSMAKKAGLTDLVALFEKKQETRKRRAR